MENQLFERDYRKAKRKAHGIVGAMNTAFVEELKQGDFFKKVAEAFSKVPRVVLPEAKANYEYLLMKCDAYAKAHGGKINGLVDYENYDATIDLRVPFLEIDKPEDKQFILDIVTRSTYFCIQPDGNGWTRLHIFSMYFTDMMSEDERVMIIEQAAEEMGPAFSDKLASSTQINDLVSELYESGAYDGVASQEERTFNMDEAKVLAKHIKAYREQSGKSPEDLATEWYFPTAQITILESGTADPELSTLQQIARFMGTTVAALLRDD